MRKFIFLSLLAVVPTLAVACGGDDTIVPQPSDASVDSFLPDACDANKHDACLIANTDGNETSSFNLWPAHRDPMIYKGGPVITGTANVYLIWYGDWAGNSAQAILEDLVKGFNGTAWYDINKTYYQINQIANDAGADAEADADAGSTEVRVPVGGTVEFVRSIQVGYLLGPRLFPGDIQKVVTQAIQTHLVPSDPNGMYFVLTSADVKENMGFAGFCSDYCGYHDAMKVDGVDIKFSFIGNSDQCPDSCNLSTQMNEAGVSNSPNGNWGADGMASVLAHELSEMVTDPDINAWSDGYGNENADKCAWRFDPTYPTLSGARANTRFNGRDYIVQQNWVNLDGGFCSLSPIYDPNGDVDPKPTNSGGNPGHGSGGGGGGGPHPWLPVRKMVR